MENFHMGSDKILVFCRMISKAHARVARIKPRVFPLSVWHMRRLPRNLVFTIQPYVIRTFPSS